MRGAILRYSQFSRVHGLICITVAIGVILYCRHFWEDAPGVTLYVEAARCMLDGRPLQTCNAFYTYPPIFALATIPLIPLPLVLQNLIWYALTLGGLGGCLVLSTRLAQQVGETPWTADERRWLYAIGALVSSKFVFASVASQNYDMVVVLLILAGLRCLTQLEPRSSTWAGVAFGCAAALKATPLVFLPYLLFKHHYRAAVAMAIALVVASASPDLAFTLGRRAGEESYLLAWLHQVAAPALTGNMQGSPHVFWAAVNTNNNSLRGLVGMFIGDADPSFKTMLYAVYAAYVLIVAFLVSRSGHQRGAAVIDGALLLISMLMLSPMSSESHFVALMLAIFVVTAMWLKGDSDLSLIARCLLILSFLLINAAARDIVGMALTTWAKDHRLLVIDALLLLVPFALLVHRTQPATQPHPRFRLTAA
jgi:alpha-1,2-mannosyltransferase